MLNPLKNDDDIVKVNPYNMNNKLITKLEVINLLKQFGVDEEIHDLKIYQQSFIHKSYIKKENNVNNQGEEVELAERPNGCLELQEGSNERLEYLGDSILGATIASYLFERFPQEDEGFMTRLRTKIVNGEMLGSLAERLELAPHLVISRHVEDRCNGRTNFRILEDVFEAFIGALYLDFNEKEVKHPKMDFYSGLGFQVCQVFIISIIEELIDFSDLILNDYNFKDQLLRYFQQHFHQTPKYKQILVEGPPNERYFTMAVLKNDDEIIAYGKEKSKKKAEQIASKNALVKFGAIEN
jgi:ribonuclease III|uniref:RNase III domain-containing protein n=1 Tax=viral metagenome TaxID=1070528 RepID=A0A6C0J969_9ZZZZ